MRRREKKNRSSSLRGCIQDDVREAKDEKELKSAVKVVYECLVQKKSSIRLLHQWQAAGGLSYVTNVYNTAIQAFIEHGQEGKAISLEVFQSAVLARHDVSTACQDVSFPRKKRDAADEI